MTDNTILPRLIEKYAELADLCYRVSVASHDRRGRFRRRHPGRRPHPALLKKVDLDHALLQLYSRFFGPPQDPSSTSTSNKRLHGSDTPTAPSAASSPDASRSE